MSIKFSFIVVTISWCLFTSGLVWGNPDMLPNHPGYPMGDAKDPVMGVSVANDPGQSPPSVMESITQASSFHDAQSVNPDKEIRGNIVPPDFNMSEGQNKKIESKSKSMPEMVK